MEGDDPGWAARLRFRQLPDNADDFSRHVHKLNLRQLPGSGWSPIIDWLHRELLVLDPEYELWQVKEKFGTLCFYAEFRTQRRWHFTLCDRCHTFEPGGRPLPAEW